MQEDRPRFRPGFDGAAEVVPVASSWVAHFPPEFLLSLSAEPSN